MNNKVSEQKILDKLNITDFRHITKDKILDLASMMDSMEPEVAKKVLEQFPHFSKEVKEILSDYHASLNDVLKSHDVNVDKYYETCNSIIKVLEMQLENDNLTFEEKKYIIDKIVELSDRMNNKDTENKQFLMTIDNKRTLSICAVGLLFVVFLGGKIKL